MKILHFADAHIDMANYGRHDPETGLPLRVLDFLKSLDTIVDTAINENVDMVIFAGDAYKDRAPAPTFQREWGRRIIRLSKAKIPTLLLVGNHDLSPAAGRAHAIHEFDTLQVPYIRVLSKIQLLNPAELWGHPVQVISLPWISRSAFVADSELNEQDLKNIISVMEDRVGARLDELMDQADPSLPLILAAHVSVQGAEYGSERLVMLGSDMVISKSLVMDKRLDYVALGHIHKAQNLNENGQPPVIYPGSIERVDFGEAKDDRFFVIADVERGRTNVQWRKLDAARPFIDRYVLLDSSENILDALKSALPKPSELEGAIVKLTIEYPRELDSLIDEPALRKYAEKTFEFHMVKKPQMSTRVRLPADQTIGSLSPLDLLDQYWKASHTAPGAVGELQKLAREIISDDNPEVTDP